MHRQPTSEHANVKHSSSSMERKQRVEMSYKVSLNKQAFKLTLKVAFNFQFILTCHVLYEKSLLPLKSCLLPLSFRILDR